VYFYQLQDRVHEAIDLFKRIDGSKFGDGEPMQI